MSDFRIEAASEADVPLILQMIKALAEYERLDHEVVATEAGLRNGLFGSPGRGGPSLYSDGATSFGPSA